MQRAINEQGHSLLIAAKTSEQIKCLRKEKFYCPQCLEKVIIRAGPKTIPHFSHYRLTNCQSNKGESDYHEAGKLLLYEWLERQGLHVQLEKYSHEINQIPDIFITMKNKRIAIEFQCSKISVNDVIKRNEGYKKINITPIWILGESLLKRINHNQFKIDFFTSHFIHQFSKASQSSLFYFCPHSKNILLLNHLYFYNRHRAIASLNINKINHMTFSDLFQHHQFNKFDLLRYWLKEKQGFRLNYRTKSVYLQGRWNQWLYKKGLFIENLPSYIYLPISSQILFKVPLWEWQSELIIKLLLPLKIGEIFSVEIWKRYVERYMYKETQFPLYQNGAHPVNEYVEYLVKINLIEQVSAGQFRKIGHVRLHNHIDDAMKEDKRLIDYLKKIM